MKYSALCLLVTLSPLSLHAESVVELSTFEGNSDAVIRSCYEQSALATKKGKRICEEQGFGDHWVCPPIKKMRLKALEQCKSGLPKAEDQAAMLYLLGLLHLDFNYQPNDRKCPEFFWFQEGSAVCVYANSHFEQLIRDFPKSKYSDMAAYKQAESAYRSYECEGRELCEIENEICGWITFLETNPASNRAGVATQKIAASLNSLSNRSLNPNREIADGLLQDVENLRGISTKLSPENRAVLVPSLDLAQTVLTKFVASTTAKDPVEPFIDL